MSLPSCPSWFVVSFVLQNFSKIGQMEFHLSLENAGRRQKPIVLEHEGQYEPRRTRRLHFKTTIRKLFNKIAHYDASKRFYPFIVYLANALYLRACHKPAK